jgi:dual specificity phosphatase 12
MEPQLEGGALAGKIVCPNKRCGAKLGNFDWAGVCCSCKEWVVPVSDYCNDLFVRISGLMRSKGFCIHRSKVDEVVV